MQLSLFTQYYIRRLLRRYTDSLNYSILEKTNVEACFQTNLNHILSQLYPVEPELTFKTQEIETLVRIHQGVETFGNSRYENLFEVEQQICRLLGLRLLILTSTDLTPVPENAAALFRFFLGGKIWEGIRYGNELYGLVRAFKTEHECRACQRTLALSEQEIPSILTISNSRYGIWINLRSPAYPSVAQSRQGYPQAF
jgi:hypothetical protein